MSISIKFNEPVSFGDQTFLTKIGCLADELFSFGNRRVSLLIDKDRITCQHYEDPQRTYLLNLAAKISVIVLLCLPIYYRGKSGLLSPLVPLSAKMIYKYGYVAKTLAKVQKTIQEKKKQKEMEEEKAKLEKERMAKENEESLEKTKKLEAEKVEESSEPTSFGSLKPTEIDQPATVFWKNKTVTFIEVEKIQSPDDTLNYRRSLKPLTDLMKENIIYTLFIKNTYLFLEMRTNQPKPEKNSQFRQFFHLGKELDLPLVSIKERNSQVLMMHYASHTEQFDQPHLVLDNRKEYDIEGAFRANEKLELMIYDPKYQKTTDDLICKLWSQLPIAENDLGPADTDPFIHPKAPLYPKKAINTDELCSIKYTKFNRADLTKILDDIKNVKFLDRLLYAMEAIICMKENAERFASNKRTTSSKFKFLANEAVNKGNVAHHCLFQDKNQISIDDISQKLRYPKLVESQWCFSEEYQECLNLRSEIDKLFAPCQEGHHRFAILLTGKDLTDLAACECNSIFAIGNEHVIIFTTYYDAFSYQVAEKQAFISLQSNYCIGMKHHAKFYHGSI